MYECMYVCMYIYVYIHYFEISIHMSIYIILFKMKVYTSIVTEDISAYFLMTRIIPWSFALCKVHVFCISTSSSKYICNLQHSYTKYYFQESIDDRILYK